MQIINTELLINLMNLSEESLSEIDRLLEDLNSNNITKDRYFSIQLKEKFNIDDFLNYCKYELKLAPKPKKNINMIFYKKIFNSHKKILTEIITNEEVFNYFYTILQTKFTEKLQISNLKLKEYQDIISYLYYNYHKKDVIINNLNKIKQLGIDKLEFIPGQKLKEKYFIVIQENNTTSKYCIRGFYTDKEMKYIYQPEENVYEFEVINPKYKIEYTKGSLSQDKIKMKATKLDFDPNTLPTKAELTDSKLLPKIDLDIIKRKIQITNFNYTSNIALKSAGELISYTNELLKHLEIAGSKEQYDKLKTQLEYVKEFINSLDKNQKEQIENYINEKIITRSELQNLTTIKTENQHKDEDNLNIKTKRR